MMYSHHTEPPLRYKRTPIPTPPISRFERRGDAPQTAVRPARETQNNAVHPHTARTQGRSQMGTPAHRSATPPSRHPRTPSLGRRTSSVESSLQRSGLRSISQTPLSARRSCSQGSARSAGSAPRARSHAPDADSYFLQAVRGDSVHCRRECAQWLAAANFRRPVPEDLPSRRPLDNPLFNGTLALEIAANCLATLNEAEIPAKTRRLLSSPPDCPNKSKQLFHEVYKALGPAHDLSLEVFMSVVGDVATGDTDTAWGLMWYIVKSYPPAVTLKTRSHVHAGSVFCGYSRYHMASLEGAVLQFLFHMKLLKKQPNVVVAPTETLKHWSSEVCLQLPKSIGDPNVKPYICNGTLLCDLAKVVCDDPVIGVFQHPHVEKACLLNIDKAMDAFRSVRGMSKVYLDRTALLEVSRGNPAVVLPLLEDVLRSCDRQPPRRHRVRPGDVPYIPTSAKAVSPQVSAAHRVLPPSPVAKSKPPALKPTRTPTPRKSPLQPSLTRSASLKASTPEENNFAASDVRRAECAELAVLSKWVKSLTGHPAASASGVADGVRNGTVLAELFMKVEHEYTPIPGVALQPLRDAQKRHNIRKVLGLFNTRRRITDHMKQTEDDVGEAVLSGNVLTVTLLLKQIRKAYGAGTAARTSRHSSEKKQAAVHKVSEGLTATPTTADSVSGSFLQSSIKSNGLRYIHGGQ